MKTIVFLALLFAGFMANAQEESYTKTVLNTSNTSEYSEYSAGTYLIRAGNSYLTSFSLGIVAAGIAMTKSETDEEIKTKLAISYTFALIGVAAFINGHIQLKKAGRVLNKEIVFEPATEGVGLAIRF